MLLSDDPRWGLSKDKQWRFNKYMSDNRIVVEFNAPMDKFFMAFVVNGAVMHRPIIEIPRVQSKEDVGPALLAMRESIAVEYARWIMDI